LSNFDVMLGDLDLFFKVTEVKLTFFKGSRCLAGI
jgi:hypothetical protein